MIRTRLVIFFGLPLVLLLFVAATVSAHHGSAAYDLKASSVTGTIVEFQFVNPHCQLRVEVKDEKGNVVQWTGEFTNPAALHRRGWTKEMFKPGDAITLEGNRAKSGAPFMRVLKLEMADGKKLTAFGDEDN
jgi:Family of unknown function (DUF6152)